MEQEQNVSRAVAEGLYMSTQKTFRHKTELLVTYGSTQRPTHSLSSYESDRQGNRVKALKCSTVTADSCTDRLISKMTVWITINRSPPPPGCWEQLAIPEEIWLCYHSGE